MTDDRSHTTPNRASVPPSEQTGRPAAPARKAVSGTGVGASSGRNVRAANHEDLRALVREQLEGPTAAEHRQIHTDTDNETLLDLTNDFFGERLPADHISAASGTAADGDLRELQKELNESASHAAAKKAAMHHRDAASVRETPQVFADAHIRTLTQKHTEAAAKTSAAAAQEDGDIGGDPEKNTAMRNAIILCAILMILCGLYVIVRSVSARTQAVMLTVDGRVIGYVTPENAQTAASTYGALQSSFAEAQNGEEAFPVFAEEAVYVPKGAPLLSGKELDDALSAAVTGIYTKGYILYMSTDDGNPGEAVGYAAAEADILVAEEKATDILLGRLRGTGILPDDTSLTLNRNYTYVYADIPVDRIADEAALLSLLCDASMYTAEAIRYETVSERIPYEVTYIENDDGFDGVTTMVSPGTEGLAALTYCLTLDPATGAELARAEYSRSVVREAVNAVSYKGTHHVPAGTSTGTYIWPLPSLPDDELPLDENGQPYVPQNPYALKNTYISSGYGERILWGAPDFHLGLDIVAPVYTEIYACDGGLVTWASYSDSYGYMVKIQHENGVESLYAHQAKLGVAVGDIVEQGQVIGYVGASGTTSGTHLHLEFRYNHVTTDPEQYVTIPDEVYFAGRE